MIRYYRKARRMNQSELSKKSNIDLYILRKIENGDISPSLEHVAKLAKALGIDKYKLAKELLNKNEQNEYSEELFIYF